MPKDCFDMIPTHTNHAETAHVERNEATSIGRSLLDAILLYALLLTCLLILIVKFDCPIQGQGL